MATPRFITRPYGTTESPLTIFGVPGTVQRKPGPNGTWAWQSWHSAAREAPQFAEECGVLHSRGRIEVTVCYDDSCGNGHNSFAITGSLRAGKAEAGGCIHEEIARYFPELAPLIKFHLFDARGPWGYPSNALYHAGDRDCWGKRKGEPRSWRQEVKFGDFPITRPISDKFAAWLAAALEFSAATPKSNPNRRELQIVELPYTGTYNLSSKFSFDDFASKWHEAPFDSRDEAEKFRAALAFGFELVKVPTSFGEGKERELDKARDSAVWPEATDEQLCLPREQLEALLMARLPGLVAEFRQIINDTGLLWQPDEA